MLTSISQVDKKASSYLFLCLLLAFYLPLFSINLGFALKPSMVLLPILIFLHPKKLLPLAMYEKCLLLFGAACCIAHLEAFNIAASFRMLIGITLFITCYFVFRDYFMRYFCLKTFAWFGLGYCVYSIGTYLISFLFFSHHPPPGEFFIGVLYDRGLYRMAGPVGSPNYLSLFLFPIFFVLWEYRVRFPKWIWIIPLGCIVFTFSLSSYCGLAVAMILGHLLLGIKISPANIKRVGWAIGGLFILLLSLLIVGQFDHETFDALNSRIRSLNTGSGRYHMWSHVFDFFFTENVYTGIGLNNLQIITRDFFKIINIHNTYLEILVEQGLLGFLSYVSFVGTLIYACFVDAKRANGSYWPLFTMIAISVNIFFVSAVITPDILTSYLLVTGYLGNRALHDTPTVSEIPLAT